MVKYIWECSDITEGKWNPKNDIFVEAASKEEAMQKAKCDPKFNHNHRRYRYKQVRSVDSLFTDEVIFY